MYSKIFYLWKVINKRKYREYVVCCIKIKGRLKVVIGMSCIMKNIFKYNNVIENIVRKMRKKF